MEEKIKMKEKIKNNIWKRAKGAMTRSDSGVVALTAMMVVGIIVVLIVVGGGLLFVWTIVSNLESIGVGILYICGGIAMLLAVPALIKHLLHGRGSET